MADISVRERVTERVTEAGSLRIPIVFHSGCLMRYAVIAGVPGFVIVEAGGILQTTALEVRQGTVVGIYVVRNPDKLLRVSRDGAPGSG